MSSTCTCVTLLLYKAWGRVWLGQGGPKVWEVLSEKKHCVGKPHGISHALSLCSRQSPLREVANTCTCTSLISRRQLCVCLFWWLLMSLVQYQLCLYKLVHGAVD